MIGSFSAQLNKATEKAKRGVESTRRAVTIKLFSAVIKDTPVLSGRLRGNWQTSLGSPIVSKIEIRSGEAAMSQVNSVVSSSKGDSTIYMRNNLPYAYRIEYEGWSGKAPEGMVRRNVARFQRLIKEATKEAGK